LDTLQHHYDTTDIRARRIPVDYASHSHHVEPLEAELARLLGDITPKNTEIAFYSTVTGDVLDTAELTADYWYRNLRQTVRLDDTVRALHRDRFGLFIESSPHAVLTYGIQQTLDELDADASTTVLGTLRRDHDDRQQFLTALGRAWTVGAPVARWATEDRPAAVHTELPTYPFQRTRHWIGPLSAGSTPTALGLTPTDHPILKTATTHPDGTTTYTGTTSLTTHPWLTDHTILNTPLLPGTALLDLALHAAHDLNHPHIEELTLHTPTPLTTQPTHLHLTTTPDTHHTGQRTLTIHTRPHTTNPHTPWTHTATATLTTTPTNNPTPTPTPHTTWPPPGSTPINLTDLYPRLAHHGYTYGPTFQGLTHAWHNGTTLHATITLPTTPPPNTPIHPALLDAALHPLLATNTHNPTTLHLPTTYTHTTLHTTHPTTLHTTITPHPTNPNTHTLTATDPTGTPVITTTLTTTPTTTTHLTHTLTTLTTPTPHHPNLL
ncbi:acyltransferase domain-containing protein, partial [Kitasatospora sp. NPDC048239]|uniref:acyltransferase domain-containing protein n=1 Tax=Kitasatospora sp. NPDC048239 TaxID=3364046 RepID=UPI003712C3CF